MFCLSKRSNGIYYIFYNKADGKRTIISTKTKYKAEANKFLMNFKEELKKREEERLPSLLLNAFIKEFKNHSDYFEHLSMHF